MVDDHRVSRTRPMAAVTTAVPSIKGNLLMSGP